MAKLYKLTDQNGMTLGDTQWGEGITHTAKGSGGKLCSGSWLHAYESALIAVLMNPRHANIKNPRLWEADGEVGISDGTKVGCKKLTTIKEIEIPKIRVKQMVRFAILCGLEVYQDAGWVKWAKDWLDGVDCSAGAAEAAEAAAWVAAWAADAAAGAARAAAYAAEVAAWAARAAAYAAWAAEAEAGVAYAAAWAAEADKAAWAAWAAEAAKAAEAVARAAAWVAAWAADAAAGAARAARAAAYAAWAAEAAAWGAAWAADAAAGAAYAAGNQINLNEIAILACKE